MHPYFHKDFKSISHIFVKFHTHIPTIESCFTLVLFLYHKQRKYAELVNLSGEETLNDPDLKVWKQLFKKYMAFFT